MAKTDKLVNMNIEIIKGTERFTEMYGAIKPEIVTPETRFFDMAWVYDLKNYTIHYK